MQQRPDLLTCGTASSLTFVTLGSLWSVAGISHRADLSRVRLTDLTASHLHWLEDDFVSQEVKGDCSSSVICQFRWLLRGVLLFPALMTLGSLVRTVGHLLFLELMQKGQSSSCRVGECLPLLFEGLAKSRLMLVLVGCYSPSLCG